jgi:hypothetical protein
VIAAVLVVAAAAMIGGCRDNMLFGNLTPVPPVHVLPPDVRGAVVLIAEDPVIETRDPNHVFRANQQHVPQGYRAALEESLAQAGFRVTRRATDPHDFVGKLAIAVSEDGDTITQIYRCHLSARGGAQVAQVDWTWPKGVFVADGEVFTFATHHVATDIATSPEVLEWLRKQKSRPAPGAEDAGAP